jgi:P pilus assembly chaperone PapD
MTRVKLMKISKLAVLLLLTATWASTASAQISVDSVMVHLATNQRPVHNVIVGNSSEHPAYVVVQAEEFLDPEKPEKVIPSTDLLASPKSFSIEANLLKSPPKEKERVFRVSFIPQDRGFGQEIEKTVSGHATVIRVLTGMGLLVFCDPLNPHIDLSWERSADKITFTNKGNVNVYLSDGQACAKPGEGSKPGEDCTKLDSKRVYGGSSYEVKAAQNTTVTFLKHESIAGEFERLTIPAVVK